jgi:hypothetical protein
MINRKIGGQGNPISFIRVMPTREKPATHVWAGSGQFMGLTGF